MLCLAVEHGGAVDRRATEFLTKLGRSGHRERERMGNAPSGKTDVGTSSRSVSWCEFEGNYETSAV